VKSSLKSLLLPCVLAAGPSAAADADGCKDHPLFNRMPGYEINSCEARDFDAFDFPTGALNEDHSPKQLTPVEGAYGEIGYSVTDGAKPASALQILRNFQSAVKAAGGETVKEFGTLDSPTSLLDAKWGNGAYLDRAATFRLNKGGREVWVELMPYEGGTSYALRIVEREAMQQAIVANELLDRINKDGFIALYINFDTGKATIKPDSLPTLDQVAQMLKAAPDLKLEVAGHTDNVGKPDANLALSASRAQSVIQALTGRGTAGARLTAKGYGDTRPVADNRNEEGRARNRRVELVKR
jgi:outer membrane protein OmpA-like peptidoglycan-associated protein